MGTLKAFINSSFQEINKAWLQIWLQTKTTTSIKKINMTTYFENLIIDYMFFIFLTHMSNFVIIGYYLLYDAKTYF